jgi:RimJ/RimL family protein N-acetyltransferase
MDRRIPADDGRSVGLRPVRADDLTWLAAMNADRDAVGAHNWSGTERDPIEIERELRVVLDGDGFCNDRTGQLVVEIDPATPIGEVSWRTEQWGPSPESRCPAIGIALLPEFRGHGYGTIAQRLLVDHLFQSTTANRVQSDTAVDNVAEQRALERIGMRREGVVRGAEYRDGRYHDHILYGILREEWDDRADGA